MAIEKRSSQSLRKPSSNEANLTTLLEKAAQSSSKCYFHCSKSAKSKKPRKSFTYAQLYSEAKEKAALVAAVAKAHEGSSGSPIVLLHFDSIDDNIVWFWATVVAGLRPAVSTPLPTDLEQRKKHLTHIANLLEKPVVLTTNKLSSEIKGIDGFDISTVENLKEMSAPATDAQGICRAVYMLTSGSSGNAKAVELRPEQFFASMKGKSANYESKSDDVFLNWIGFDHVANLTETHLHALYLAADQHHVAAADVISDPWLYLRLISQYRVSISFAPNFFLSRLVQTIETGQSNDSVDLSCLRRITSGGEANLVETASRLETALQRFGANSNFVCPGFGMTETCAGCIYSKACPSYDLKRNHEFATLGQVVPGLNMRLMKEDGTVAAKNETGILQVSGPIVFKSYFNNPQATAEAFTADGWFTTGDKAIIDENGNLCLSGRDKETININGVKYSPHELETALEEAGQEETGIVPSYTAVFSVRPHNAQTEEICVLYHPTYDFGDITTRIRAADAITQVVGVRTSVRPKHIVPLPKDLLPKSALGKLSRAKLRTALEKGEFREYEDRLNVAMKQQREERCEPPTTDTEKLILSELRAMLESAFMDIPVGVNNSIFDLGITSTDLFQLGQRVRDRANLDKNIPVGTFLTDPTIRGIAASIDALGSPADEYVPVVPLQKEGSKAPLFLVHPGSGDVLVFVALAKYFPDRPVYGLRTRCLYSGNDYHKSLYSMAKCYYDAIKKVQPEGPYAIAGYSLGSTVAFEIAKLLEADGSEVPFLGALDSPPHMRGLIENLDFIDVLLNVAYFLELITEEYAMVESISLHDFTEDEALDVVLSHAPPERLEMLSIDHARLRKITEVTHSFGLASVDYKPSGLVANIDVFWVQPLLWVAQTRKEWYEKHLVQWKDFSREPPRFYELDGMHSMMLNADYVDGTAKKMRAVIRARGL